MTETTQATEETVEQEYVAADLAQVVENATASEQKDVVIVEVKPLEASPYVDPISQEYFVQRSNRIDTPDFRTSPEGIGVIHKTITFIGEQPLT